MELTTKYLKEAFEKYNNLYFDGELKMPQFEITNNKRQLGQCWHKTNLYGERYYGIKVSKFYDRNEHQYDNTLIHEMIHLYSYQQFPHDKSRQGHGWYFKMWCDKLNKFGWELSRLNSMDGIAIASNNMCNKTYTICVGRLTKEKKWFVASLVTDNLAYYQKWLGGDNRFADLSFFESTDCNLYERLGKCRKNLNYKFIDACDVETKYLASATKVFAICHCVSQN